VRTNNNNNSNNNNKNNNSSDGPDVDSKNNNVVFMKQNRRTQHLSAHNSVLRIKTGKNLFLSSRIILQLNERCQNIVSDVSVSL
jgi:hypothetical protein